MTTILCVVGSLALIATVVNGQFRFDYTFNTKVGGWLKIHEIPANFHDAFKKCDAEGKQLSEIIVEWAPNEPDNYNDSEDCIVMVQNGTMADVSCTETFPFICYKESSRNMGLNECGTVDNAYQLDTRSGSCYKFHTIGRTWEQAYMICMAEGGHLAIINNETEVQVIKDLFAKYPPETIFSTIIDSVSLGFRDWGESGVWYTVHVDCQFRFDYTFNIKVGGWLKLHTVPSTFFDAFRKCSAEGAVLASPLNTNLKNAMVVLRKNSNIDARAMFTGINSAFSKASFASVEGVPIAKMPVQWAAFEPDNLDNNEDCIAMLVDGTLADVRCTETFPFVCYKKKTKTLKINECGTVDDEYTLDHRTGSCYKLHRVGRSWRKAYMTCMAEGGYLAIINSDTEAEILKDIYAKNPSSVIFAGWKDVASVGVHDWGDRGVWYTVHGQPLNEAGFSKFSDGEPNNNTTFEGGSFCGALFRTGLLDDIWCSGANFPFICEKDPNSLNPGT